MRGRTRWSGRRRRLLAALAAGAVVLLGAGLVLPDVYGVTTTYLGALCAFLLVVAVALFAAVPGPGTLGRLLRATTLAGASLVGSVLLLLAAPDDLRALWWAATAATAAWTAAALWLTRRDRETPEGG